MEGIFFVLIGGALFAQAFNVLGLYADGRTVGVITGGLGLLMLLALTLAPQLLIGGTPDAEPLAETSVMKLLILVWAVYAVAVGAQGLWEFEERPIGFFGGFLVVATLVLTTFLGWYVNLEAPFRRTPIGMDTTDNTLDVVVDPQRRWRWKDADLLAARVEAGLTFPEEAAAFRVEGERVIAAIETRASPFDDGWTGWRPPPDWAAPPLPPGWDSLPGADVDLNRV